MKRILIALLSLFFLCGLALGLASCASEEEKLVDKPSEAYVIECLEKVPGIVEIAAVTEDNDPMGNLNKPGGYITLVYFSYELVNQEEVSGDNLIDKGTDAGGCIEVYENEEDATKRDEYLALFDGGVLTSGSHTVVGTCVVRTSDELTASQQRLLEANIIAALKGQDDKIAAPKNDSKEQGGADKTNGALNNPTEAYIIECLEKVPLILEIKAATEDNDPMGNLNKPGGYTALVYFSYELVNQEEVPGDDLIDKGTDAGGGIEVYATEEYANRRNSYLASFDGGPLSPGSHTVVGTMVVRTSDELTASQQKLLETNIIAALQGNDEEIVTPETNSGNNGNGNGNENPPSATPCTHGNLQTLPRVEPTCTATGLTEGKKCLTCGEITVSQTTLPLEAHDFKNYICSVCTQEFCTAGVTFSKYASYNGVSKAAVVYRYVGEETEIHIPQYIDGYIVIGIGEGAFEDKSTITKIDLPSTLTFISGDAFSGCEKLKEISIPEGVKTLSGYGIFMNCTSLESIVIPNTVTDLGMNIFKGCTKLTTVTLGNQITKIPSQAFLDCSALEEIILPASVTEIGDYGFGRCIALSQIEILGNLIKIGASAFSNCENLEIITIPLAVTTIESGAFSNCSKLIICCESSSVPSGWNENWNRSECPTYFDCANPNKGVTSDGLQWELYNGSIRIISYQKNQASVIVPATINEKTVTSIADYAFINCSDIKEITLPNTLKSIGLSAFLDCSAIATVHFDGTAAEWNTLVNNSQDNNEAVTNAKVYLAGGEVLDFSDPKYLKYTLNSSGGYTITDIGSFNGSTLTIPANYNGKPVTAIGEFAFYECRTLLTVTIGQNVTTIEPGAFFKCYSLQTVIISGGVSQVGQEAFYGCLNLTTVTFEASSTISAIKSNTFHSCEKLSSITLPSSVTSIGMQAFYGCKALKSITIPSKVTTIGDSAFDSTGLTSITLPTSVRTIGFAAFCNCSKLTTFTYRGTKTQWNSVSKGSQWSDYSAFDVVTCSNGSVSADS